MRKSRPGKPSLPANQHVRISGPDAKSVAIIITPQTGSLEIREGQKITPELEIYQINRRQVLFRNLSLNTCELVNLVESIPD